MAKQNGKRQSKNLTANSGKRLDRRTLAQGRPENLKPFVKGDPRINLSGRPKLIGEANRKVLASAFPSEMISQEFKKIVANYTGDPEAAITYAERIAISQAMKAASGDTNAAREMRSATEGNKMELTGADGGPIQVADIESIRAKRWAQVAPALAAIESVDEIKSESKDSE